MTSTARSSRWQPIRIASMVTLWLVVLTTGCATSKKGSFGPPGANSPFREKGAPWTIVCLELRGSYRGQQIEQFAESLRATPGMTAREVFVRNDPDGMSRLYHGVYYRKTDPETKRRSVPKRLRDDMRLIKELVGANGERFFYAARKVRWPYPDVGDPRWRLVDVDGVYSLQVAVFEPTDEFWNTKEAAADHCRMLRDEGFEAYYHHSEGASMVTVGVFGDDAIIRRLRGLPAYSAPVIRLQQHELLRYNRLNGAVYTAGTAGGKVRVPSRLVRIPKRDLDKW